MSAALPGLPIAVKSMVNELLPLPNVSASAEGGVLKVNAANSAATTRNPVCFLISRSETPLPDYTSIKRVIRGKRAAGRR